MQTRFESQTTEQLNQLIRWHVRRLLCLQQHVRKPKKKKLGAGLLGFASKAHSSSLPGYLTEVSWPCLQGLWP